MPASGGGTTHLILTRLGLLLTALSPRRRRLRLNQEPVIPAHGWCVA
jgi:hypothetical protein